MALLATEAIVLHAFDYLESSRIVRLVTRDAGMRSVIAKGARKSRRRFGTGLDLFAQGSAVLHTKPGRDLDILSGFEDVHARAALGADLERFNGANAIAEIALLFGRDGADVGLFEAVETALDTLTSASGSDARDATIGAAWQIVAALGVGPAVMACAECATTLADEETTLFTHSAGGALCRRCARLSAGGRQLPPAARAAIAAWMEGRGVSLDDADARAHQRLLREFLAYHLHDDRTMRAFDQWERGTLVQPMATATLE